ncbi:MAG TPA: hypothetical protein VF939_20655 [Puia sp.]
MGSKKIILKLSKDDEQVGYLYLPKHPKKISSGIVKKTISINELITNYKGIPLNFDFDDDGEIIGIEILG